MSKAERVVAPVAAGIPLGLHSRFPESGARGAVAARGVKMGVGGASYAWKYSRLLSAFP